MKTAAQRSFTSQVFGNPEWDGFVEQWAPIIHDFVGQALGTYGREPLSVILPLEEAAHAAWATASFDPGTGQTRLSSSVAGSPGTILEKLCHEFTHGSLNDFPEGDPFYEEGFVDYSVWVMAHAPVWKEHREAMITAAEYNIAQRRERAMKEISDWDRKRWAGGLFAMYARGPFIIAGLRMKKYEGNYSWLDLRAGRHTTTLDEEAREKQQAPRLPERDLPKVEDAGHQRVPEQPGGDDGDDAEEQDDDQGGESRAAKMTCMVPLSYTGSLGGQLVHERDPSRISGREGVHLRGGGSIERGQEGSPLAPRLQADASYPHKLGRVP